MAAESRRARLRLKYKHGSEQDLETELDLPTALVSKGGSLRAETASGRTLEQGLPERGAQHVRIGVAPVQPVGGVVSSHLQLGVNSLGDAHRLCEIRIQIPEKRSRQTIVLQRIGPQHVRICGNGRKHGRVEPLLWRRIGDARAAVDDQVPK